MTHASNTLHADAKTAVINRIINIKIEFQSSTEIVKCATCTNPAAVNLIMKRERGFRFEQTACVDCTEGFMNIAFAEQDEQN